MTAAKPVEGTVVNVSSSNMLVKARGGGRYWLPNTQNFLFGDIVWLVIDYTKGSITHVLSDYELRVGLLSEDDCEEAIYNPSEDELNSLD